MCQVTAIYFREYFSTDSVRSGRAPAKQVQRDERTLAYDDPMLLNRRTRLTWFQKDVIAREYELRVSGGSVSVLHEIGLWATERLNVQSRPGRTMFRRMILNVNAIHCRVSG